MFTLEIGGRPTAIIDAAEDEARAIVDSEAFRSDLRRLQTDGVPLWDGAAPLTVRAATEEEIAEFDEMDEPAEEDSEEGEEDSEEEEDEDDDEAAAIMFFLPLDDLDDEED